MKKMIAGMVVAVGLTGAVHAGDPERGEQLTESCVACHGETGADNLQPVYPIISGLGERFLFEQMLAIQEGQREVPEMSGILDDKSEQDLKDLAAFYNGQEMPEGEADPDLVEEGEQLYRGGNKASGVAACIACHGPQGKGNEPAGYPRVSGQSVEYSIKALKDYRSGDRVFNSQSEIMGDIASKLTDSEIEAVAEYMHGLY